jgi:hypothetical protein
LLLFVASNTFLEHVTFVVVCDVFHNLAFLYVALVVVPVNGHRWQDWLFLLYWTAMNINKDYKNFKFRYKNTNMT